MKLEELGKDSGFLDCFSIRTWDNCKSLLFSKSFTEIYLTLFVIYFNFRKKKNPKYSQGKVRVGLDRKVCGGNFRPRWDGVTVEKHACLLLNVLFRLSFFIFFFF